MDERRDKLKEALGIDYFTKKGPELTVWNKFLKQVDKAYKEAYDSLHKLEEKRIKDFRDKFGPPLITFTDVDKPKKTKKKARKK